MNEYWQFKLCLGTDLEVPVIKNTDYLSCLKRQFIVFRSFEVVQRSNL